MSKSKIRVVGAILLFAFSVARAENAGERCCGAVCGAPVRAPEADGRFDRGGVTFDLQEICGRTARLTGSADEFPVQITCPVPDRTDSRYELPAGQCGYLWFKWKSHRPVKEWDQPLFRFVLTLPSGVEYIASRLTASSAPETAAAADGSRRYRFKLRKGGGPGTVPRAAFNSSDPFGVLVRTAPCARGPLGKARVHIEYDGRQISNETVFEIRAADPVRCAAPKRYMNGVITGSDIFDFTHSAVTNATEIFAGLLGDMGVRWVIANGSARAFAALRANGVRHIARNDPLIINGFAIGEWRHRPAEDRYVTDNPLEGPLEYLKYWVNRATCPIAVYTESKHFREYVVPLIKNACKGADGLWENWEPYYYAGKGCMCVRCRRAFAEFVGVSDEEMARDWPKEIKRGRRWGDRILDFRAREHARIVRTIDKYVREFSGGESSCGLIPAIAWIENGSWYHANSRGFARYVDEVCPRFYAGDLKWLNPWGPYAGLKGGRPKPYEKRVPLTSFVAAEDVRRTVERDYPDPGRRPRLMAFPLGYFGNYLSRPETLSMALDSFFFNRWEASVVYYMFRGGMDARYMRAFAAANARSAKYEDFVIDGRDVSGQTAAVPVKEYASPCRLVSAYVPASTNVSTLQVRAYELGGSRIAAVFNFWEKGEAFFDLCVKGVAAGDYFVTDEDGVIYPSDGAAGVWTARELDRGIRLAVGAARTKVFEIRSADKFRPAADAPRMTQEKLSAVFAERVEALAALAQADAAEEAAAPLPKEDAGRVL